MATSSAAFLIVLIALPFGGSCLAALFPANARNAEAYLAGGVALTALALVIAIYSQVVNDPDKIIAAVRQGHQALEGSCHCQARCLRAPCVSGSWPASIHTAQDTNDAR